MLNLVPVRILIKRKERKRHVLTNILRGQNIPTNIFLDCGHI